MIQLVLATTFLISAQSQAEAASAQEVAESAPAHEVAESAPAQETTEQEVAVKDDDERIVCRSTAVIGSKFKKRICATKKEWATLSQRGSDTTREFQKRGVGLEPTGR